MTGVDNEDHNFTFSICNNDQICQNEPVMVSAIDVRDPDFCYIIARWDDSIQPQYNTSIINTDQWTFTYQNGDADCGPPTPRTWIPTFICSNSETMMGEVTEVGGLGSCIYEVDIFTRYACSNYTTNPCIWNDNGKTLNLTGTNGLIMNYVDDQDLIWSVSPCNNGILCRSNMAMSTVGALNNCIQRLALWDGGLVEPAYSSNNGGQWEFVYENGDNCGTAPTTVTRIFWNCDPLAGVGRITAASEKGTCDFEIQIDSSLAC